LDCPGKEVMYSSLNWKHVIDTLFKLHERIDARFPNSGLSKVCGELERIASVTEVRAEFVAKPLIKLRVGIGTAIGLSCTFFVFIPALVEVPDHAVSLSEFVTVLEAGSNLLLLLGAGLLFLVTVETRIKRGRALKAIHELRAIAHVIDMHQLTKDPSRLWHAESTPVSPKMELTPFELTRYLDYCSEMLAVIGKVAAMYVQKFHDPVVLAAANEVESLTTGLSRKVWQKLMIIHQVEEFSVKK
jgi:hypothetical protein